MAGLLLSSRSPPDQIRGFDVPVKGLETIAVMKACRVTAISMTADKTLLFDRDSVLSEPIGIRWQLLPQNSLTALVNGSIASARDACLLFVSIA